MDYLLREMCPVIMDVPSKNFLPPPLCFHSNAKFETISFRTGISGMQPVSAVAPVPIASIPGVGMSPPLVSSVSTAPVPPLANGTPAVIQPLSAFGHPGMPNY